MTAVADLKADVRVIVTPGSGFEVRSSISGMYGEKIRAQIESTLSLFPTDGLHVAVEDGGALPFVLRARLEAALSRATAVPLPELGRIETQVVRERSRRTRLYIPGHAPRFFLNASLAGAEVVVLDLEDAVPEAEKLDARSLVRHAAPQLDWQGAEVAVRVNVGSLGLEDIRATANRGVHLFLVPKVESAQELVRVAELLDELEAPCQLMPLIETALGVERAFEIASASPRVVAISLGLEDLLADLGAQRTPGQEESAWAQGRLINAARAAGIQPLASVFPGFEDLADVSAYALTARQRGYEGIGCIHPSQVKPVHQAFKPTEPEMEWAAKVIEAFESQGKGAGSVNGSMIDAPVYRRALRVVALAGDLA